MTWDDLRPASWKGLRFLCETLGDEFEHAVACFDYPYRNAPDVEDMGTATTFRVKAWFFDEDYDGFPAFNGKLIESGPGDFVHPVKGTFKAQLMSASVRHDDREQTAEIDLTFKVIELVSVVATHPTLKSKAAELKALDTSAAAKETTALADSFTARGIPASAPTAGLGGPGYLATVSAFASTVKKELAVVNTFAGQVQGFVAQAVAPLNIITSVVATASLPVVVLEQITSAVNSVAGEGAGLLSLPGKFTGRLATAFESMSATFERFGGNNALKAVYLSKKARSLISGAALELRLDESAEKSTSFSLKDYDQPDTQVEPRGVMTMDDIDRMVATARQAVDDALPAVRASFGSKSYGLEIDLKAQALRLQEMADEIRLRRPQIVEVELESDTSLHIFCHDRYRDLNRAVEVMRLNKIKDPNFLTKGTRLRVYVS